MAETDSLMKGSSTKKKERGIKTRRRKKRKMKEQIEIQSFPGSLFASPHAARELEVVVVEAVDVCTLFFNIFDSEACSRTTN